MPRTADVRYTPPSLDLWISHRSWLLRVYYHSSFHLLLINVSVVATCKHVQKACRMPELRLKPQTSQSCIGNKQAAEDFYMVMKHGILQ